jgi:hypothetical protein
MQFLKNKYEPIISLKNISDRNFVKMNFQPFKNTQQERALARFLYTFVIGFSQNLFNL